MQSKRQIQRPEWIILHDGQGPTFAPTVDRWRFVDNLSGYLGPWRATEAEALQDFTHRPGASQF